MIIKRTGVLALSIFIGLLSSCSTTPEVKSRYWGVKVIDYTTHNRLKVKQRDKDLNIKMIGVNLPDKKFIEKKASSLSGAESAAVMKSYRTAESFLKKAVSPGDVINIEKGFHGKDKFGNTLVYLYLPNMQMLNIEYIKRGYTFPDIETDNIKYQKVFYEAALEAKNSNSGFWPVWKDVDIAKYKPVELPDTILLASGALTEKLVNPDRITVMTYNVENLMDTKHDPGRMDYQYLPLSAKNTKEHKDVCMQASQGRKDCLEFDWSEKELAKKMQRVAGAILSSNNGKAADLLILQEVENIGVLEKLTREHLNKKGAGYRVIVLPEGDDFRGIDIAMVSRLQLDGKPRLHTIPFNPQKSSRDILEARFKLPGGETLIAYGLHFPSQASKVESRIQAMVYLNSLLKAAPAGSYVIAAGDCNVTSDEIVKYSFFQKYAADNWLVSHELVNFPYKGTTYYPPEDNWSYFDIILFSKNFSGGTAKVSWKVDVDSIKIENSNQYQFKMKNGNKYPMRYEDGGVSDHWPVSAVLKIR